MLDQFDGVQTQVLGLSVDSIPCLKAWADSLGGITYPLLSDFYPHGEISQAYGVLRPEGYSERAIFVIDKAGVIRYVDVHDIDEQPNNDVLFEVLDNLEPQLARARKNLEADSTVEPVGDIVMYCTQWCPNCRRARAFFADQGIKYTEIDITRDRKAAARVRGWASGNETTPTFDIRGEILIDYDQIKLEKLLGIRK
ncbi:MAG: redoxin domain-containing protein [Anaerolineales bacterium]|nr:redoxin domain-containing protein [Anaerolineales bacterium]